MRIKRFNEDIDYDKEDWEEEDEEKKPKLKFRTEKLVDVGDWNNLVKQIYGKPYNFQQQYGCQPRGLFNFDIPSEYTEDDEMDDEIPEVINGEIMGVKFKSWLERDPEQPVGGEKGYNIDLFWARNFYPDIHTVANDLYEKGYIEAGSYIINIDW